jgi:mannose/fructose/N-acetylgalactosamine-specific phosphotransferase system component IIC
MKPNTVGLLIYTFIFNPLLMLKQDHIALGILGVVVCCIGYQQARESKKFSNETPQTDHQ